LEFFLLNLAWILALSIPMAVLLSTLMAFGRLSDDGEITAMKAGGISILKIIAPVAFLSILLAFFLIWFNNQVLPDANYRTKLLASDIGRKRPTLSLEPGVIYREIDDYSILVESIEEKPDTSYIQNVYIEDNSKPNSSTYIWAQNGKVFLNQTSGILYFILYNGEMHELDLEQMEQYKRIQFPRQLLTISVKDMFLTRSDQGYRGDREKSAKMMQAEVTENNKQITSKKTRAAQNIDQYFSKYLPSIDTSKTLIKVRSLYKTKALKSDRIRVIQQVQAELTSINNLSNENSRLMVEVHKKYSIPAACFVFVMIGAPLGIMSRKGSMAVAGGIAFVFFLIYWASLIGGEELADNNFITPFWAMWSANIICGLGGIYLIFHSIHEATFINWIAISDGLRKIFKLKRPQS
ncbi:MAG: YjgP/YjgQ family permease, partial [Calditrichaeota bacterium]